MNNTANKKDTLVAVYGTLKQGHYNNMLLQDAVFVGPGSIKGHRMYQRGFPFVMPDDTAEYDIQVELYRVSDSELRALDSLEGHPDWYKRSLTDVYCDDGRLCTKAYVYKVLEQPSGTVENLTGVF
jgi:gamma-glutamylcyclotransferase (GGCT)/AIG2-like uncharacterized protein YtfP